MGNEIHHGSSLRIEILKVKIAKTADKTPHTAILPHGPNKDWLKSDKYLPKTPPQERTISEVDKVAARTEVVSKKRIKHFSS